MTTSLELSKKLAEAGLKIETDFFWWKFKDGEEWFLNYKDNILLSETITGIKIKIPAPSTDELLAVIPEWTRIFHDEKKFCVQADYVEYHKEYNKFLPEALTKIIEEEKEK